MPKLNPNIPKPTFQSNNSGIFLSRLGNPPPHMTPGQAEMYIYTSIVNGPNSDTGIFIADCGCRLTREDILRSLKTKPAITWTNRFACSFHHALCAECQRVVCTCGNPDGYGLDFGEGIIYYCTDHYDEALKEYKKQKRREWWSGFWSGFFGGEK